MTNDCAWCHGTTDAHSTWCSLVLPSSRWMARDVTALGSRYVGPTKMDETWFKRHVRTLEPH